MVAWRGACKWRRCRVLFFISIFMSPAHPETLVAPEESVCREWLPVGATWKCCSVATGLREEVKKMLTSLRSRPRS